MERDLDGDGYFKEVLELENQRRLNSCVILLIAGIFFLGVLVVFLVRGLGMH